MFGRRRGQRGIVLLPPLAAALTAGPGLLLVRINADDGLVAANAMLVARGAVPHRDYFSPITPGADLLYGLLFRLTGPGYVSMRLLTLAGLLAGVVILFAVARRLVPAGWAAGVAALWGAWMAPFLDRGPYHVLGPAAVLAMAWALLRSRRARRPLPWLVEAGVVGGLAVFLIQSAALALAAGAAGAALGHPRGRLRGALAVVAGGLAVALSVGVWLMATGAVSHFLRQTLGFAGSSYLPANFIGIPVTPGMLRGLWGKHDWALEMLRWGIWALALVGPLAVGAFLLRAGLRRRTRRLRPEAAVPAVVGMALFAAALYRPSAGVLWPASGLTLVLLAVGTRALARRSRRRGIAVALAALVAASVVSLATFRLAPYTPFVHAGPLRAEGRALFLEPRAAEVLRRATPILDADPQARVAFLPALKAMYLLTGRPPPISFVLLRRGYNTPEQVRRAQRELLERRVRWVVFTRRGIDFGRIRPERWEFERFLEERYAPRADLGPLFERPLTLYELDA